MSIAAGSKRGSRAAPALPTAKRERRDTRAARAESQVAATATIVPSTTPEVDAQLAVARWNAELGAVAAPVLEALPPAIVAALTQVGLQMALAAAAEASAPVAPSIAQRTTPYALPPALMAILAQLKHKVQPSAAVALVEVDDIAAMLSVTRWTVYRWASEGRIPCVRAGRKVRFEMERVIAVLRSEGPRVEASLAMPSVQVTTGSRATRTVRPRETPKRRRVAGDIPRALPPHRAQPTVSAQQKRAESRQEPVDEIARRRAVVAATRALSE
jgi:excisionase family DNA binding protein